MKVLLLRKTNSKLKKQLVEMDRDLYKYLIEQINNGNFYNDEEIKKSGIVDILQCNQKKCKKNHKSYRKKRTNYRRPKKRSYTKRRSTVRTTGKRRSTMRRTTGKRRSTVRTTGKRRSTVRRTTISTTSARKQKCYEKCKKKCKITKRHFGDQTYTGPNVWDWNI
jgi:hypothetical protein